jgi:ribose transport system permease protein
LVKTFTIDKYPSSLPEFGKKAFLGFPYILVIAIMTAILLSLFFSRTIMGRRILATGGNPLAARLSGVSNNRSVFLAHTLSLHDALPIWRYLRHHGGINGRP